MKLWKKILLGATVVIIVSQAPFAYRRYKLGKLNAAILSLNSQRQPSTDDDGLMEVVGVSHVHSFLGGHSDGTFQEIIAAANTNKLNFVLMTEHPAKEFDTSAMTLKGDHGGVIFVNGNEVVTKEGDRLLLLPGSSDAHDVNSVATRDFLAQHADQLAIAAYPENFKNSDAEFLDGVEIYNVYTNAQRINAVAMFFDGLWSYRSHATLLFARFFEKPTQNLKRWDKEISSGKKRVAFAGNDAHANVGFSLHDFSGKTLGGIKLDPYTRSFRLVRMHVLLKLPLDSKLGEKHVLDALKRGNCFIGFDVFGDSTGFRFHARDENENVVMGEEITIEKEVRFNVTVPVPARILLLKDGNVIKDDYNARSQEFLASEKGSYRVEVYLPQLGNPLVDSPWILSNPIYVR